MANGPGLVAVTASDTTVYNPPLKRIWVGGTGTLTIVDVYGNTVEILAPVLNVWTLFQTTPIQKVKATGTSATAIVGDTNANQ